MKRRSYVVAAGLFAVLLATGMPAFAGTAPDGAHGTSGNAGLTAQDSSVLGATALEVNGATWDPNFADAAVPGLLSRAGVGLVRWPGGSYSDTYDWRTNSPGGVPFGQVVYLLLKDGSVVPLDVTLRLSGRAPERREIHRRAVAARSRALSRRWCG